MEDSIKIFQQSKNRVFISIRNSTSWYLFQGPRNIYPEKNICIPMYNIALFTIAKIWRQPKCPRTDDWIKELWYIDLEYYSDVRNNEIKHLLLCEWT